MVGSPILVSSHKCFSCLSLSPPMNSRILFASPWVETSGADKILPAAVVSSNYTLLLRFTTGTLNVRQSIFLALLQSSHPGLARAPIMCTREPPKLSIQIPTLLSRNECSLRMTRKSEGGMQMSYDYQQKTGPISTWVYLYDNKLVCNG